MNAEAACPHSCTDLPDGIPDAVVDAHAHLYPDNVFPATADPARNRPPGTLDRWKTHTDALLGAGRLRGAVFIPFPRGDAAAGNRWLLDHLKVHGQIQHRSLMLVTPAMSRRDGEALLDQDGVVGFKPYHTYSRHIPTFESTLADFVPEWVWAVAHERAAVVLLHLVRHRALADSVNIRDLRRVASRYPGARLVLAHAGRGFHAPNTVEGVEALSDIRTIWFDSSAICEARALRAVLHAFGPSRLMWGSDYPVSQTPGKCVTVGDAFAWICPDRVDSGPDAPAVHTRAVGAESLDALLRAAREFGLNRSDLQAVFHDTAAELFGLPVETDHRNPPQKRDETVHSLYRHARERIPGGTQLLSKRPEMFAPDQWPAYFRECRGCDVWDTDGTHYVDFSYNGIGACLLGFRDPDVTRAVTRRLNLGSMCTLNPPEEVELADRLCALHPWADCARFARTGGEAAAAAVRIARAATGRSKVAVCGYHGWHDWYLAANLGQHDALDGHLLPGLSPAGVPRELAGTTLTFAFDDPDGFAAIMENHRHDLACVIMEPCRHRPPAPGFLETVRAQTRQNGVPLIFDEITVGFRLALGGAHLHLGIEPDMAVFAKALGNGHPIAAIIGTRDIMDAAQTSFISSTYWTEGIGPAAALACLEKMERVGLPSRLADVGRQVREHWRTHAQETGLPVQVGDGFDCMPRFRFDHPRSNALKTLYTQIMLQHGALATTALYPTLAHDERALALHDTLVRTAFEILADAIRRDAVSDALRGPEAHAGFRRLVD